MKDIQFERNASKYSDILYKVKIETHRLGYWKRNGHDSDISDDNNQRQLHYHNPCLLHSPVVDFADIAACWEDQGAPPYHYYTRGPETGHVKECVRVQTDPNHQLMVVETSSPGGYFSIFNCLFSINPLKTGRDWLNVNLSWLVKFYLDCN